MFPEWHTRKSERQFHHGSTENTEELIQTGIPGIPCFRGESCIRFRRKGHAAKNRDGKSRFPKPKPVPGVKPKAYLTDGRGSPIMRAISEYLTRARLPRCAPTDERLGISNSKADYAITAKLSEKACALLRLLYAGALALYGAR